MKQYFVELNYPFDPNVESYLYSEDVFVIEGEYGDLIIKIETELSEDIILEKCNIDVRRIIKQKRPK